MDTLSLLGTQCNAYKQRLLEPEEDGRLNETEGLETSATSFSLFFPSFLFFYTLKTRFSFLAAAACTLLLCS